MAWLWLALLGFVLGSLPFSVWLGRLRGKDVRAVGDGNPGATNALRAGGWQLGLAVLMLDVSKAAAPVGLAYQVLGIRGAEMWAVAIAPMLGHAWSPFLRGKGGKALAVILGMWIGLTLWEMPLVLLSMVVLWNALLTVSGWAVLVTINIGLAYLLAFHRDPLLIAVIAAQILLILWKHRADLAKRPGLKKRFLKARKTTSP